jgi:hypothetical protein
MVMVDADKDGSISYGEFASFAQERFVFLAHGVHSRLQFELNTTMRGLHETQTEKRI